MKTFSGNCQRCTWIGPPRLSEDMAQGDSVWHVYEEHTPEWVAVVGDRPPLDVDPRTLN